MTDYHFDRPAGLNPIDQQTVVGKPLDRIDGPRKVSGQAPYAQDYREGMANTAYGFVVGAGIAAGRIARIDTRDAEAASGVLHVMTHRNAPRQGPRKDELAPQLVGPQVHHYDEAVALVVAATFEQARHAAKLVRVSYVSRKGRFDLAREKPHAVKPPVTQEPDSAAGDFARGFAAAPAQLDVSYTTPDQSHMMMEPHATIARWEGNRLTVWTSNQMVHWAIRDLAGTLMIPKDNVRVVSAFVGDGFGGKLWIQSDAVLAALGARAVGRPVKLGLARPQIMNNTAHRPATIQRLRIGTDPQGRILAIGHEVWSGNQAGRNIKNAAQQTRLLYAGKDRMTSHRLAEMDLPVGHAMRAPGEAVGLLALEAAMDELAEKLNKDPVELRIINDVQFDPEKGPNRPFSTRKLVECLRRGAEEFGWSKRNPKPGQVREGNWLIGMGVASAIRNNLVQDSGARVTLRPDGSVLVETQMTDIGTGSYTIIAQTAAEMLGLSIDKVEVRLGDSRFPASAGSGGSWGANSATAGVFAACEQLRRQIAQRAGLTGADLKLSRWAGSCRRPVDVARAGGGSGRDQRRRHDRLRRSGKAIRAGGLRCAFLRGGRRPVHRRDADPPAAERRRRGPHSQSQVGAQSMPRRDDHGHRRGADRRVRGRHPLRLLRQSRSRRIPRPGPRRHSRHGCDLPRGTG